MDFYTIVLRRSGKDWVVLCLENGIVGQGHTKARAILKLREAIESFEGVRDVEQNVYNAPVSIKELHEFLTHKNEEPVPTSYELRAVHA